ncbi:MAG TPA: dienelactone hydrolase family protein [Caulobacteraceae bacterium]|nr:dienelactone hydrolase family protein [Caulobacteraceae bacterium]
MAALTRPEGAPPEDFHLSRRAVGGLIFAGYAAAGLSAQAEPIHTDEAGLIIEEVVLPAPDGFRLPGYLARPKAPGRFPAVVVASEVFGLHDYIKDVCRRLAKLGYVAVAPAFFVRVADPAPISDLAAVIRIVGQASDAQVMGDVGATLKFLDAQDFVDPQKIAITGFCWGGGTTWLACETFPQFKAGVAWYGRMAPPPGAPGDPKRLWPIRLVNQLHAPVLGLYGAKDGLAASIPAMRQALAAAGKTATAIIVYPDAGHGFHADYRDSYNAADAKDGWMRMLAHFASNGVAPRPYGAT